VGRGWPAAGVRHEMLSEALEIIRLLWSGGYRSHRGRHLTLEDARVFDLPDTPPRIAVAAGGSEAAQLAAELGDAIFATAFVTPDDVRGVAACGPDPRRHLEVARQFVDAGFDHLALLNAGPDPDGFFEFFARDLAEPLRALDRS
jgi:alkanesulfonate monooxygenase SsuD/methylene tetrahydromethanopterin reductase-like flavin-dependent oxidoreductase (luciferase family)